MGNMEANRIICVKKKWKEKYWKWGREGWIKKRKWWKGRKKLIFLFFKGCLNMMEILYASDLNPWVFDFAFFVPFLFQWGVVDFLNFRGFHEGNHILSIFIFDPQIIQLFYLEGIVLFDRENGEKRWAVLHFQLHALISNFPIFHSI